MEGVIVNNPGFEGRNNYTQWFNLFALPVIAPAQVFRSIIVAFTFNWIPEAAVRLSKVLSNPFQSTWTDNDMSVAINFGSRLGDNMEGTGIQNTSFVSDPFLPVQYAPDTFQGALIEPVLGAAPIETPLVTSSVLSIE